jgi:Domain of unknown function (DUF932)
MHTHTLATRFSHHARVLRADTPLTENQMRLTAPSIFAEGKHISRSERYGYIPTIDVLRRLRREGFEPFMVAQGASRIEGKAGFTKHMIRLRHGPQGSGSQPNLQEVPEVILINSHDGASSYQMLAGLLRFVCCNGLVVGSIVDDIRIPHRATKRSHLAEEVIDAAFRVVDRFEVVRASVEAMKALTLSVDAQRDFARAALALRFGQVGPGGAGRPPPPICAERLLETYRPEDRGPSLWAIFQRVQQNVMRGGQEGRSASCRRLYTRPVVSIDRSVNLNRALWALAEQTRQLAP